MYTMKLKPPITITLVAIALALGAGCTRDRDTTRTASTDTTPPTTDTQRTATTDQATTTDANRTASADSTARNTTAQNTATPTEAPRSDMAAVNPNPPVSAIQHALSSDQALADAAKSVQVTAEGNKIILSGTVASRDIKNQVEKKAKELAEGWNIDNKIDVQRQQ